MQDKVIIGVASIRSRFKSLRETIKSLQNQSVKPDVIYLYLNDFLEVPPLLKRKGIVTFLGKDHAGDLGDAGKFYMVDEERGIYFLSADDDLWYNPKYIEFMISGIEKNNRKKIATLHGSVLKFPVTNFYRDRRMISFKRELKDDTPVHIAGTGVTAFHTDTIKLSRHDFPIANIADIWLGVRAQQQGVGIICLSHKKGFVRQQPNTVSNSIFQRHVRDEMKIKQAAQIINSIEQWKIN